MNALRMDGDGCSRVSNNTRLVALTLALPTLPARVPMIRITYRPSNVLNSSEAPSAVSSPCLIRLLYRDKVVSDADPYSMSVLRCAYCICSYTTLCKWSARLRWNHSRSTYGCEYCRLAPRRFITAYSPPVTVSILSSRVRNWYSSSSSWSRMLILSAACTRRFLRSGRLMRSHAAESVGSST